MPCARSEGNSGPRHESFSPKSKYYKNYARGTLPAFKPKDDTRDGDGRRRGDIRLGSTLSTTASGRGRIGDFAIELKKLKQMTPAVPIGVDHTSTLSGNALTMTGIMLG